VKEGVKMFDNLLRESHLPEQSNKRSSSSGGEERQDPTRPPPSHEPQTLQHENYGTTVGIHIFSIPPTQCHPPLQQIIPAHTKIKRT